MRTLMFLAAFAVMLPAAANATRWVLVSKTSDDTRYIDLDAVILDGSVATVWLKTEYLSRGRSGEASSIEKWMEDCAHQRAKLLALTLYRADGRVISSAEVPRYREEWVTIVPGSVGEGIYQRICAAVNGTSNEPRARTIEPETT